jgi:peptidoglycan/LPS O-acetylase OafA/YrhL
MIRHHQVACRISSRAAIGRANVSMTTVAGIEIPSTDPTFLVIVGIHILLGLIAMLSPKRPGRHPRYGTIYFWCLAGVFLTATSLAAVRWAEDYHLFILGALSFGAAFLGRTARRRRWRAWARLHIVFMGLSYVLLLTAFYVDNGKNLPPWKELPPIAYCLVPGAVGLPLIIRAARWHPLTRISTASGASRVGGA